MELVEDLADLEERGPSLPVCVLSPSSDDVLAREAADLLGLDLDSPPLDPGEHRRPAVEVAHGEIDVVAFSIGEGQEPVPVRLCATQRGLLIVARDIDRELLRRELERVGDDGRVALAAALAALARRSGERLDDLVAEVQRLDVAARGYTSAPERRDMANMRARLFALRELEATQHRLLAPEQELADALPDSAQRLLRQASRMLDDNRATAGRIYALLGDVLTQQSSVVSERLTLVSTIFLPLTVATGFFGMNFGWMTDRIGSLPAFLTLGLVVPVLLVAVTLVLLRRLSTPA